MHLQAGLSKNFFLFLIKKIKKFTYKIQKKIKKPIIWVFYNSKRQSETKSNKKNFPEFLSKHYQICLSMMIIIKNI